LWEEGRKKGKIIIGQIGGVSSMAVGDVVRATSKQASKREDGELRHYEN